MTLTCVTAVYNAIKSGNRENLIRCVRSVAALKTEHEHLIYDGGSTDGTVELLRELEKEVNGGEVGVGGRCRCTAEGVSLDSDAERIPRLRVVSEPDAGVYDALNKGVRDARGEWFYVLGCDDYVSHPETFDKLIVTALSSVELIIAPTWRETKSRLYTKLSELNTIFVSFPYSHQSVIMRTHIMRELGGFDDRYRIAADWRMLMTCYSQQRQFWYTEEPIAYYAAGGLSESGLGDCNEQKEIYAEFWHLKGIAFRIYMSTDFIPPHLLLAYRNHSDPVVRASIRNLARSEVKAFGRIVLWPLVCLRRKWISMRMGRI